MSVDAVEFARKLIQCPSVTPEEGGALDYLQGLLEGAGFRCTRLPFTEEGEADVDNLYAEIGSGAPHLMFAGHTDVVPAGDETLWRHPPFAGTVAEGCLFGRGAADMKGGIACFLAAVLDFIKDDALGGTVSLLITGDEEGPAVNGTIKMLQWLQENGIQPTDALVGEPTNPSYVGEAIKIGRRGSLNGWLTVTGSQGHVAYPHLASNPIDGIARALVELKREPLDEGTSHFLPSHLEITSVDVGNPTVNVIPEKADCHFNIRYNDLFTPDMLESWVETKIENALTGLDLSYELTFKRSADCFVTKPGRLVDLLSKAVQEVTKIMPSLSTSGGTSDARFIKDVCPVVELGLSNATIHQIDEHVSLKDMEQLTAIYKGFLLLYFQADNDAS